MNENPMIRGGEFAGRYTIERELGRGGAAIVYLAHDNRQDRQVAIKVLHRELGQAIGAQRFLREIKHSSALHHPHLLAIHESGEADGFLYYVMPYMRDGSLRARIAKEKQLPLDDALRIARQVGEALAYAHSRGIVHRDIKPDNVLFSADHACLADFGIARAVDSVAADTLTSTGLVVGTPAYMSPEQASGEKEVDARSDQYSLACLLYEMVTGLPPFIGATQQAVISQRFTQPPPSMRAHRPSVPDHVERAVKRALAVVPADRFASVHDFISALHDSSAVPEPVSVHAMRRRWFAVGAAAAVVTLAVVAAKPGAEWVRGAWGVQLDTAEFVVLPFLSEESTDQGDRVASGLYAALSSWEGLSLERDIRVRDAVAERGGRVTSLSEAIAIARELGAGRLVWGRVAADGDGSRIYADLYDVADRTALYEGTVRSDSARFSEATLRRLANSLLTRGAVPERVDDGHGGTRSFRAWQAYLRGLSAVGHSDFGRAIRELTAATAADPDFAIAQLRLAEVASWLDLEDERTWTANAARAVALRDELTPRDALRAEALLAFGRREYGVACERYDELVQADTLDARAWFGFAACLKTDNTVVRDGASPSGWSFRRSYQAAGNAFRRAFELEPRLLAVPRWDTWIRSVFAADRNRIRIGDAESRKFGARPSLVADTISYVPYPMPNFERESGIEWQARRTSALSRNSDMLLTLARAWTAALPQSADAFRTLAMVQENRGQLSGSPASPGAFESLLQAKRLAATAAERSSIAEAQVRLLLKLSRFSDAAELADSVLRDLGTPTPANSGSVARLAGLIGRAALYEAALQHFWAEHADIEGLDQTVTKAGGELLGRATLAMCGPPVQAAELALVELIDSRVQPERRAEINRNMVEFALSYVALCTGGRSMARASRDESLITRAQVAFARGNNAALAATLDTLDRNRAAMRPGDISPNLTVRDAALRAHIGDTSSAVAMLDRMLKAMPTLAASIFEHPLEGAMLVRAMVMRADLAHAAGDAAASRRWSRAVLELWATADQVLRPTLARMERLSQIEAAKRR